LHPFFLFTDINQLESLMNTTSLRATRALALTAIAVTCSVSALAQTANVGQSCDTSRTASTYVGTASGALPTLALASPLKLTPCASYTGMATGEISTVVDSKGTIFMGPIYNDDGLYVARSKDNGTSWDQVQPLLADGTSHVRIQPYMQIDPKTDRIFFNTGRSSFAKLSLKTGFDLSYTDDGGDTWSNSAIEVNSIDWGKILPGAPLTGTRTNGYPNNLYFSTPTPISTPAIIINPKSQAVMKSIDGGASWNQVGSFSIVAKDYGCPASEYVLWGDGAVAPDGTIYIGGRRCNQFALSVSKDEGKTWTVTPVPGAKLIDYKFVTNVPFDPNYIMPTPLTIDGDGNLYVVYPDDKDLLRLTISRDKGKTWTKPVVISDPKVTAVIYPAITVKKPGTIAIAYYGSSDRKKFNGYMAESVNALSALPVFKSQTINDPAKPLHPAYFDVGYLWMFLGGDLNEIVQIRYAPNGDLLTAFTEDMCPLSNCRADWDFKAHAKSKWQAVLGRLVHN
jgi:hypothetical protein